MNLQHMKDFSLPTMIKPESDGKHKHPMHHLHRAHSHLQTIIKKRGSIWKVNLEDMQRVIDEMKRLEEFVEKFIDEKGTFAKCSISEKESRAIDGHQDSPNKNKKGKKSKIGRNNNDASNMRDEEITAGQGGNAGPLKAVGEDELKLQDSSSGGVTSKSDEANETGSKKNPNKSSEVEKVANPTEMQKNASQTGGTTTNHGIVHLLWQELRYLIREDLERAKIIKRAKELQIAREQFLQDQEAENVEEKSHEVDTGGPGLIPEKSSDFGSKEGSILSTVSSKIKDGISKGATFITGRHKKKRKKPETRILLDVEGRAIRVNVIDDMKRKEELLSIVDTDRILAGHLEHDLLDRKCAYTVWNLKRLVDEIRGSQIFIHKSGLPVKRKNPKVTLARISGGL